MKPAYLTIWWSWLALAIIAAITPPSLIYWQIAGIVLLLLALIDAWKVWQLPDIKINRQVSSSLSLGVWSEVTLNLSNSTNHFFQLEIFDDYPINCDLQGQPQTITLPPLATLKIQYHICPQQRGSAKFSGVHLLHLSSWRIWKRYHYIKLQTPIRIYPNFATMTKYALFAAENRLGQLGIRQIQRRGDGLEFHQLREYRIGDMLRQLDWNATSRHKKLISKEYQDERDQQIIFLIDCGQRMLAKDGKLSHFDHSLNAILLLSYVALKQGDALGLMTFSGKQRWLKPQKGMKTVNRVLDAVYDLQPSTHTSDYLHAANQLLSKQRKRSLVILISNLRAEDNDELLPALQLLRKRHLVLLASLQERILTEVLEQPIHNLEDALRYTSTLSYLQQRYQAHNYLKSNGIVYLDTTPEQLPIKIINRYLDIKHSGML
ncbi:MAG: DUF58 domain-containing protein [Candidatus Marithrix sp.]